MRVVFPADLHEWLRAQAQFEERSAPEIVLHALAAYRAEAELMEQVMARELNRQRAARKRTTSTPKAQKPARRETKKRT